MVVEDEGTGMTEETRRRALEPFFTTKGAHGTGLGLAMVYGIASRHGGSVAIESLVGHGTTVTLALPAVAPVRSARAKDGARAMGPLRVLAVDDDASVLVVTLAFLTSEGHTAVSAVSGEEALVALRRGSFDLVITDAAMPEMSGQQLACEIKRGWPGMPVILLSGFGDLLVASGERLPDVDVVIGKPLTREKLRTSIARAGVAAVQPGA
jgi:CheY-like chemotaxis protein